MNWLLAVVIVAVTFLAGCALWLNYTRETANEILDHASRFACYERGFEAARYELSSDPPPPGDSECSELYSDGFDDGKVGRYDPPSRE